MALKITRPQGTEDITPENISKWYTVEQVARDTAKCFGFHEMRIPTFESTDLFLRSVGETTDVVQKQMEQDKPKVLFADSVTASSSSILIGALAKLIKQNGVDMGQKRLFQWMRENGYLIKRCGSEYNLPTQRSMERGLMEIKETSVIHSGYTTISKTPKVTGKGHPGKQPIKVGFPKDEHHLMLLRKNFPSFS